MTYKELQMIRGVIELTAEDVSITVVPSKKWRLRDYCPSICEDVDRDLPPHICIYYREGDTCVNFLKTLPSDEDVYDLSHAIKGMRMLIILLNVTD